MVSSGVSSSVVGAAAVLRKERMNQVISVWFYLWWGLSQMPFIKQLQAKYNLKLGAMSPGVWMTETKQIHGSIVHSGYNVDAAHGSTGEWANNMASPPPRMTVHP